MFVFLFVPANDHLLLLLPCPLLLLSLSLFLSSLTYFLGWFLSCSPPVHNYVTTPPFLCNTHTQTRTIAVRFQGQTKLGLMKAVMVLRLTEEQRMKEKERHRVQDFRFNKADWTLGMFQRETDQTNTVHQSIKIPTVKYLQHMWRVLKDLEFIKEAHCDTILKHTRQMVGSFEDLQKQSCFVEIKWYNHSAFSSFII